MQLWLKRCLMLTYLLNYYVLERLFHYIFTSRFALSLSFSSSLNITHFCILGAHNVHWIALYCVTFKPPFFPFVMFRLSCLSFSHFRILNTCCVWVCFFSPLCLLFVYSMPVPFISFFTSFTIQLNFISSALTHYTFFSFSSFKKCMQTAWWSQGTLMRLNMNPTVCVCLCWINAPCALYCTLHFQFKMHAPIQGYTYQLFKTSTEFSLWVNIL